MLQLKKRLARRHAAHQDVAAGIHTAPGRASAASAPASDPFSRSDGAAYRDPLRTAIVAGSPQNTSEPADEPAHGAPARMRWAQLLKRVFDIDLKHCPQCGGDLKIIAANEEPAVIVKILTHLRLPASAPRAHRRVVRYRRGSRLKGLRFVAIPITPASKVASHCACSMRCRMASRRCRPSDEPSRYKWRQGQR